MRFDDPTHSPCPPSACIGLNARPCRYPKPKKCRRRCFRVMGGLRRVGLRHFSERRHYCTYLFKQSYLRSIMLKAIFFGSVGTLAETSELQCKAFNKAFDEAGLDWFWHPNEYRELLREPGGVKRIMSEANRRKQSVDAETIHALKVAHFRDLVATQGLLPRPGVLETLGWARTEGLTVSWVTTTGRDTIDLILMGLRDSITASSFSFIHDTSEVRLPKPAPDIYHRALQQAGVGMDEAGLLPKKWSTF